MLQSLIYGNESLSWLKTTGNCIQYYVNNVLSDCGFIKKEISNELRQAPVIIPISDWEDFDDEAEEEEPGIVEENLIVNFDDPFEEKEDAIDPKDLMKICYELLEKEEPELLIIFDERAKGHPNREIAKYLCLDVKEVEKMWKRILRLLRKKISLSTFL